MKFKIKMRLIKLLNKFPKLPKDENCSYANGNGYIQWSKEEYNNLRNEFLDLVKDNHPSLKKTVKITKDMDSNLGVMGRCLDDMDSILYAVWCRFMKIDNQQREWGQTYYAIHSEKARKTICLNKN